MIVALVVGGALLALGAYMLSPPSPPPNELRPPLDGHWRVSSPFGARIDPITGLPAGHAGIDFATPEGTPVYAVCDGTVYRVDAAGKGSYQGNGNAVLYKGLGYRWAYLHLRDVAPGIVGGATVKRGQLLGHTGNTGRTTGPHLHFQATSEATGLPVDPAALFPPGTFA